MTHWVQTTGVNSQTYPQAFRSSGTSWASRSRRALTNKRKIIGIKRERKGTGKKGRRDKTKVYTDRPQGPLAIDPREGAT